MQINFRQILNWDICFISKPTPVISTVNGAVNFAGYSVVVQYAHHGSRRFFFDNESERSWVLFGGPKKEAEDFYQIMCEKQKVQRKKRIFANMRQK